MYQRKAIRLDEGFSYSCRQCGSCCRNIGVQLSPLDVWHLARQLGLSTGEVLERHARLQLEKRSARPFVFLRGALDGPCSFLANQLCGIYEARPGACRMHPIGSYMGLVEGEDGPVSFWGFQQRFSQTCPGWGSRFKYNSLREYIARQGAGERLSAHLLYADFLNRLGREHHVSITREAIVELVNCLFNLDLLTGQEGAGIEVKTTAGPAGASTDFTGRFTMARAIARGIITSPTRPGL